MKLQYKPLINSIWWQFDNYALSSVECYVGMLVWNSAWTITHKPVWDNVVYHIVSIIEEKIINEIKI